MNTMQEPFNRNALLKKWTDEHRVYVVHGLQVNDGKASGIGVGDYMFRERASEFPSVDLLARVALALEFGDLETP